MVYIGHSQGTTQMFYALAYNEDVIDQYVSVFLAFGPVTRLTYCKSDLLVFVSDFAWLIEDICDLFGIYDILPSNYLDDAAAQLLCGYIPFFCEFSISLFCDEDTSLDDTTRLEDYTGGHFPSGTSLKCLVHYSQIINSKQF